MVQSRGNFTPRRSTEAVLLVGLTNEILLGGGTTEVTHYFEAGVPGAAFHAGASLQG